MRAKWERDFKKMHELGFEFTHFAPSCWAQLEPEEGRYDFCMAGQGCSFGSQVWFESYHVYFYCHSSCMDEPEIPRNSIEEWGWNDTWHGARQHASFASPLYRELSYKMIENWRNIMAMTPVLSDGNSTTNLLYSLIIIWKRSLLSVIFSVPNTIMTFNF